MTNRARNMEWPFRLSSFSHSSFANAAFVIHHFHAMFELKPLSQEALPAALERATRYRLLNEPAEAESICLDVLRTDPDNQQALVILLVALTDRVSRGYGVSDTQAQEPLPRLRGEYERSYYAGLTLERQAKAHLPHGGNMRWPFRHSSLGIRHSDFIGLPSGSRGTV